MNIDQLENLVPCILKALTNELFVKSRTETATLKKRLLSVSLAHIVMQATAKEGFISPLLLSIGIYIHQVTRSRSLIDLLSALGLCASYTIVMNFERSAAFARIEDEYTATDKATEQNSFCQWVADNYDFIEDTLNGSNSTHTMGIITCQTPEYLKRGRIVVPKRKIST